MTSQQFFESDYVQNLIKKYKRTTTILRPHKSNTSITSTESKFGGAPNFAGFDSYPICSSCNTPLNFVFQLYKRDFPEFYFPDNTDLFQLFRCPNKECPDAYSVHYDLKMFHFYFDTSVNQVKELSKPKHGIKNGEKEVPDCYLKPSTIDDFPNYDDFEGADFNSIEDQFGNEFSEEFMEHYTAIQCSKLGGYPSYTQFPQYPTCSCGKTKEFLFQLSSEDVEDGVGYPPPPDRWSPHGIMIGDVGNIYFYVCKACGRETIESNWDCY